MDYKELFSAVKNIINEWDPKCLLAAGAPLDEYDDEVQRIIGGLRRCKSTEDVVLLINEVFVDAFGNGANKARESLREVAEQIFSIGTG
jgi:hypothetical protein